MAVFCVVLTERLHLTKNIYELTQGGEESPVL